MVDPDTLKVGDVFYTVKEKSNMLARKKIHQEIDGEIWFKYDRPPRSYEIVSYEILGIIRKQLEGEWSDKYEDKIDLDTQYCVKKQVETSNADFIAEFYFYDEYHLFYMDKNEALKYKEKLEKKALEMDMK